MSRKPVVVVGSINMDLVATAPEIPQPGQTLIGSGFATTPGGKGANQAVAAARLGYPVHLVGLVGTDVFGQALRDNLAQAGVDPSAVSAIPGPSGLAQIAVAEHGENSIIVIPGANAGVTPAYIDRHAALLRSAGVVLCQLELPLATVLHTLAQCASFGVPVILDPAPAAPLPDSVWPQIAWFTPNESESALYTGADLSVEETAATLHARGLHGALLKRGAQGAYLSVSGSDSAWIAPFPVEAVDTVAAGDCFNGAFAVALLEGLAPAAAARFAAAAAAISVTRHGAQASMPTRAQVDAFLAKA